MCCGLRKTDIFKVTMAAVKGGEIAVRTSKRDNPVSLPIHPVLAAALAERPQCDTLQIVVTSRREPFTADGFDSVWHKLKTRLEAEGKVAPGLTLHGLRHTLGTMLKEAGTPDGDIADVLGQSSTAMARHYSREAKLPAQTRGIVMGLKMIQKGK
jgi:integrase